jgi:hypothetical protein
MVATPGKYKCFKWSCMTAIMKFTSESIKEENERYLKYSDRIINISGLNAHSQGKK